MSIVAGSPSPPPLTVDIAQRAQTAATNPTAAAVAVPAQEPQPLTRSGSQLSRNGSKRKPPPRVDSLEAVTAATAPAPAVEYVERPVRSDSLHSEHGRLRPMRPTPIAEEPHPHAKEPGETVERLHVTWEGVGRDAPLQTLYPSKPHVGAGQQSPLKRAFSLTRSGSKGKREGQDGATRLGRASSERIKETAHGGTFARPAPLRTNTNPTIGSPIPPSRTLARSSSSAAAGLRTRAALFASKLHPSSAPPPSSSPSASAFANSPQPRANTPQHFAPPSFSPAEVELLRRQLAGTGQALLEAAARERELQHRLDEAGEHARIGRDILWQHIAQRDAEEAASRRREEEMGAELARAEAHQYALIKSHSYTIASMQREIDALHSAWIKASPDSAPPLVVATPQTTTSPEQDFPTGPMSDEEGPITVTQKSVPRTPRSAFGLFRADEPVGDWEEGSALSGVERTVR